MRTKASVSRTFIAYLPVTLKSLATKPMSRGPTTISTWPIILMVGLSLWLMPTPAAVIAPHAVVFQFFMVVVVFVGVMPCLGRRRDTYAFLPIMASSMFVAAVATETTTRVVATVCKPSGMVLAKEPSGGKITEVSSTSVS